MAGTSISIAIDGDLLEGFLRFCQKHNAAVSVVVNSVLCFYLIGEERDLSTSRGYTELKDVERLVGNRQKTRFSVYVETELLSLLDRYCKLERVSRSSIISRAIAVCIPGVVSKKFLFGEYKVYL